MKIANKISSSLAYTALLASCTQMQVSDSEVIPDFRSDTVVPTEIVATFAATKVSYNEIDAGTVFNLRPQWEEGDEIIALDESGADYLFTVKTVNEESATLSGNAPADCQLHLIFCPGISASNPMTVDYTAQAGAQATMPAVMLSYGEVHDGTGSFTFRNAGGILGISAVKGIPEGTTVTKITVSGENLSTAEIAISGSALALTATPKADDAISVEGLNLTVDDANGTLSSPVLIAVPAGAVIASVSACFPKVPETMTMPAETPQEGVDYVTIAGIKWAKWNIGASSETDYGWYFFWGGTEGYYRYENTWQSVKSTSFEFAYSPSSAYTVAANDYVYVKTQTFAIKGHSFNWVNTPYQTQNTDDGSSTKYTKYLGSTSSSYKDPSATDADALKIVLDLEDDAARANWGGNWRMPSTEDFSTLKTNTTSEWIVNYHGTGINGRLFTSKVAGEEDHSIFFPAAGYGGSGFSKAGEAGNYWANKVFSNPTNSYGLFSNISNSGSIESSQRYHGFPVRPVLE